MSMASDLDANSDLMFLISLLPDPQRSAVDEQKDDYADEDDGKEDHSDTESDMESELYEPSSNNLPSSDEGSSNEGSSNEGSSDEEEIQPRRLNF